MFNKKIETWKSEIDKNTNDIVSEFSYLSYEEINWKINAEKWSIGQIIDHIIVTNESYYPIIKSIREGNYKVPFIGKINFITKFFGNLIYNSVEPTRKRKVKTFPVWQPAQSNIELSIIERFKIHQNELKNFISNCEDLLQKGKIISSPANKIIVYKLDKAFDILVAHEQRHFNQAKEVLELMKKK